MVKEFTDWVAEGLYRGFSSDKEALIVAAHDGWNINTREGNGHPERTECPYEYATMIALLDPSRVYLTEPQHFSSVWNYKTGEREIRPENMSKFLNEIQAVCEKYNLSLTHEDDGGSFLVEVYKPRNMLRLWGARRNF